MTIAKVDKIGSNDVLLGKGPRISHNPGNIKYRAYCDSRRGQYKQLGNKGKEKKKYCMTILKHIKSIGGRFIRYDTTTNSWYEVDDSEARTRISQRLRQHASKCIKPSLPPPTFAMATTTIIIIVRRALNVLVQRMYYWVGGQKVIRIRGTLGFAITVTQRAENMHLYATWGSLI